MVVRAHFLIFLFRFGSGWSFGSWTRPKPESSGGYCGKHIKTCLTKRKKKYPNSVGTHSLSLVHVQTYSFTCVQRVHAIYTRTHSLSYTYTHSYAHIPHMPRLSSSILRELLRTYSEADAKDATQLAERLIALVISDPKQFVFDNLLQLAPVAALEGRKSLEVR